MTLPLTCGGRSIVWLQNKRDATLERLRGPAPRREDAHEFRVGRLKHERVCVPRDDGLLEWAMQVMRYHGDRKAVLEVSCIHFQHLCCHHVKRDGHLCGRCGNVTEFDRCQRNDRKLTRI